MQEDKNGFFRPVVDVSLCVNCGACRKVCPQNDFEFKNLELPTCYAVSANDEMRAGSSSGAFFPLVAQYVLGQGGYVCGAAFDDNMNLRHIIISDEKELYKLKGSKYLQSRLDNTFSQIKNLLTSGKLVLFTGTPCQVAGLQCYLRRDYSNLITIDLICHGVPSQKVFSSYLASEFPGEKIKKVNFRDKINGWGDGITMTVVTDKGKRSLPDEADPYMQAFFANIDLRESCYQCKFTRMPRCGDFTMADFWGIPEKYNDGKGMSCIFLNTAKSKDIFEYIRASFHFVKEFSAKLPIKVQPQLKGSVLRHSARDDFFQILDRKDIRTALDQTLFSKKNVALLNFHWENVNFGAILTSFALHEYLHKAGYYVKNIDYVPDFPWIHEEPDNAFFDAFRRKHMNFTRRYASGDSLTELNEETHAFIVGSDQVWRPGFIKNDLDAFFFRQAGKGKKRIAYAASFGISQLNLSSLEYQEYSALLRRFDSVSVREQSGVEICSGMNIEPVQVLDPVFLLTRQQWSDLADEASVNDDVNDIVYYTISDTIEDSILGFIEKHKDVLLPEHVRNITFNISVEEWLKRIRDCRFFITDSFHGSCFAIIFNKPFICINPSKATISRMETLFASLGISGRLFSDFNQVPFRDVMDSSICYETTNRLWEELRKFSVDFLVGALEKESMADEVLLERDKQLNEVRVQIAKQRISKVHMEYLRCKLMALLCFKKKKKAKYMLKLKRARCAYRRYRQYLKSSK